jgi:D-sedoheptulose 7-phosphate isomerase
MDYLQQLIERYPTLNGIRNNISDAYLLMEKSFSVNKKLLVAGNGGSAADADHIVGELMKGFVKKRPLPAGFVAALEALDKEEAAYLAPRLQRGLPTIALSSHAALMTATLNDVSGNLIYAQQVCAYGNAGDVFMGISTSGNAKNIFYAMLTAKAQGLKTIALSGGTGGRLARLADVALIAPETETYKIQELHLPIYHTLCLMLEEHFFNT